MAQDPERNEEQINPSHDLDMVPLFTSQTITAETEADVIRGILDVSGIPSILVRATGYPSLGLEIRVPQSWADEARRVVEEQREAGPEAAIEGEAASERGE
jgi:hypothetical protein